jgi:hypothetical protein
MCSDDVSFLRYLHKVHEVKYAYAEERRKGNDSGPHIYVLCRVNVASPVLNLCPVSEFILSWVHAILCSDDFNIGPHKVWVVG